MILSWKLSVTLLFINGRLILITIHFFKRFLLHSLQIQFHEIIGEPHTDVYSFDCVWVNSFKVCTKKTRCNSEPDTGACYYFIMYGAWNEQCNFLSIYCICYCFVIHQILRCISTNVTVISFDRYIPLTALQPVNWY